MDAYEYSSIFVEKSIKLMKEYYPNNKINHLKGNVMDISDIKKRYDVVWSS
jgi:hypothetical protein